MSLSCSCDGDYDWWYTTSGDYAPLSTKRSRKCCSCRERIPVGALSVAFDCYKFPENDIEERIYCDEVPLAPKFMCERCGDLYNSFDELGFCIKLGDDMRELVREYAEMNREARERREQL